MKKGFSLVEIMFATLILGVVAAATMQAFRFISIQSVRVDDRAFATQKAIQMMEELRGLVQDADSTIGVLDDYDNGSATSNILTTRVDVTSPADPVSGNGDLKYSRKVTVAQINEPLARRVYVRVYDNRTNDVLAETVSVMRTIRNQFYPSQVYDIFILVLENIPGWWVSLSTMRPMFDNVIQDLQTRNPGLTFRVHYVTRLAYGRDPYYTPYTNEDPTMRADLSAMQGVYFYPGLVNKPSVGDFFYYVPETMGGRRNVDGVVLSSTSYSMADQYNHAVRYPDEERLYAQDVAAARAAGTTPPEISWRMLLERMNCAAPPCTDSFSGEQYDYRNAIVFNLHGELVPFPPIRNYSDAARDYESYPATHPTSPAVRVVTHPENIAYSVGSQVRLRVYSYLNVANPLSYSHDVTLSSASVVVASAQPLSADISVRKMVGNRDAQYGWENAVLGTDYSVTLLGSTATLITLFNSPLRCHELNANPFGLEDEDMLYRMEYIPGLIDSATYFIESSTSPQVDHRDLADNDDDVPKNTARWVIRINNLPVGQHAFHTRIGANLSDGVTQKPYNLSRTYAWVGTAVPLTEQFQFIGDPRHMPYADVKFRAGYNWYANNSHPTGVTANPTSTPGMNLSIRNSDYPGTGFAAHSPLWNGGPHYDVPRYFQMIRSGLLRSNGLWSSVTGFSSYYTGIGGEFGADGSNGFDDSLPIVETPWNSGGATVQGVQEITGGNGDIRRARIIANTADTWHGWHWLGELFPDSHYNTWVSSGNLPIGSGNFYRKLYSNVVDGTTTGLLADVQKITGERGAASFFNGNPSGNNASWFTHEYRNGNTATIQTVATTMASDFNFPLFPTIRADRPFLPNSTNTGRRPPEWSTVDYGALRTTLSIPEVWYEPSGSGGTEDSSSLVRIIDTVGGRAGAAVMNGLSPQDTEGTVKLAKLCVIGLLRGYMKLGEPTVTVGQVPQIPLVSVSSPTVTDEFNNPAAIDVTWVLAWSRWDGAKYTTGYPDGYVGTSTMHYNVKYSRDNGRTWRIGNTTNATSPGVYEPSYVQTGTSYSWLVPASDFPTGNYLLRVEAYRSDRRMHYTYHTRRVFIRR